MGPAFAAALAMAAAGGLAVTATIERQALPAPTVSLAPTVRRVLRDGDTRALHGGWRLGPGWCQAKVQRMARKRRNQARHRAHCKRRRSRA